MLPSPEPPLSPNEFPTAGATEIRRRKRRLRCDIGFQILLEFVERRVVPLEVVLQFAVDSRRSETDRDAASGFALLSPGRTFVLRRSKRSISSKAVRRLPGGKPPKQSAAMPNARFC